MNKYHDKMRKIEYKKITKMLVEEARRGGKKVAMNDEDNEIRLTDDEGSDVAASNINLNNTESTIKACNEDHIGNVLPQELILSLNRPKYFVLNKSELNTSNLDTSNTIKDLNSKLGEITRSNSNYSYLQCKPLLSYYDWSINRLQVFLFFPPVEDGFHSFLAYFQAI
jgi:hypothetical protein